MALYKRRGGKIWHTDFSVDGQRYRMSLETTDRRAAKVKERELITQVSAGNLNSKISVFTRMGFAEAAERHLLDRMPRLAPRSIQTEKERLKYLVKHFGQSPLTRISADMITAYIAKRKQDGAANKTINLELGVIRGVLKRAKRWQLLYDDVKPLPVRHQVGLALEPEEKIALETVAGQKPEWENAGDDSCTQHNDACLRSKGTAME